MPRSMSGLRLDSDHHHCTTAYYAGYRYSSPGGRRLAELLQDALANSLDLPDGGSLGMSLPLLRETRMPAVIVEIGPASVLVEQAADVVRAIGVALADWVVSAWD